MDTRVAPAQAADQGELALVLRLVRDYLGPQKLTLLVAVLCMAGGAATTAALAWLLDPAIKLIFLDKRADMLLLIPVAIVVVVLLRAGLNFGETVLSTTVGQRIVADAQRDMVRSMAAFDLERLNRVHSGQFISNVLYDVSLLRDAVVRGVAGIAKEGLSLVLLGSVMLYQDWRLSVIAVLRASDYRLGHARSRTHDAEGLGQRHGRNRRAGHRRSPRCSTGAVSSRPTAWRTSL